MIAGGNGNDAPRLRVVPAGGLDAEAEADDALVEAFVEGDESAFTRLVRRHEELVLRIVRRYARDRDDAFDLSQRTFVRAFQAARRTFRTPVREHVPFKHWLVRIAVNLARNHVRDAARRARTPFLVDDQLNHGPAPLERMLEAERLARFRRALLELPRRQREVMTLRLDAELPFAEIAEALDITENAAKVSYFHAAKRLRKLAAKEEDREKGT